MTNPQTRFLSNPRFLAIYSAVVTAAFVFTVFFGLAHGAFSPRTVAAAEQLRVSADGTPTMQFLDAQGKVTHQWPEKYAPCALQSAYTFAMDTRTQHPIIDWSECDLVEVNPLKLSGVPILKDTRVQADSIVENYLSGSSVDEIAFNFRIPAAVIRQVLAFAKLQQPQLQL